MLYEWDDTDREAMAEGFAMRNAFRQPSPRRGIGRSNRSALSRAYRPRGILKKLRVIDGKATV